MGPPMCIPSGTPLHTLCAYPLPYIPYVHTFLYSLHTLCAYPLPCIPSTLHTLYPAYPLPCIPYVHTPYPPMCIPSGTPLHTLCAYPLPCTPYVHTFLYSLHTLCAYSLPCMPST